MAITKVAQFNSSPTNATDYQAQNAHINAFIQQMGNQSQHLTEWTTTTVPQIALGVYLRHAGVLYIVDTAHFDIATGDLSAADNYYIKLTTSGASLTVAWEDDLTDYAWNTSYQGLYNGTSQIMPYTVIYDAGSSYVKRKILNLSATDGNNFFAIGSDGIPYINASDLYFNSDEANQDHILYNESTNAYEFYADDDGGKTSFGKLCAGGYNPKTLTASNIAVSSVTTLVVPSGIYQANIYVVAFGNVAANVQTYINGAWVALSDSGINITGTTGTSSQFSIMSDGTNTRLNLYTMSTSGSATLYLSKY